MARCWRRIPACWTHSGSSTNCRSSTSLCSRAFGPTASHYKGTYLPMDSKHPHGPAKSIVLSAKPTFLCRNAPCRPGKRCATPSSSVGARRRSRCHRGNGEATREDAPTVSSAKHWYPSSVDQKKIRWVLCRIGCPGCRRSIPLVKTRKWTIEVLEACWVPCLPEPKPDALDWDCVARAVFAGRHSD